MVFESNILNIYGEKGKEWLINLPELVKNSVLEFELTNLQPATNLSYNYILSAMQNNKHVILKFSFDKESLKKEADALNAFRDCGAVKLLAQKEDRLLLERIMPGTTLRSYFPEREIEALEIICEVINKLHRAEIPQNHNFCYLKDMLRVLDDKHKINDRLLEKGRFYRDELLASRAADILLHGDLHHDNILKNSNDWVFIDPKGVIGEPAYEICGFIRNPMPELLKEKYALNIIQKRIEVFSDRMNIDLKRIQAWCFVGSLLSLIWAIEDGIDTKYFEEVTKIFDKLT